MLSKIKLFLSAELTEVDWRAKMAENLNYGVNLVTSKSELLLTLQRYQSALETLHAKCSVWDEKVKITDDSDSSEFIMYHTM